MYFAQAPSTGSDKNMGRQEQFSSSPSFRNKFSVVLTLITIALGIIGIAYGFAHPDMTQTRVFLNTWQLLLAALLCGLLAMILREDE